MFYPVKGDWEVKYFRKVASEEQAVGDLLAFSGNGLTGDPVEKADASDTKILGICMKAVASTDSDYASNTRVPVAVPKNRQSEMYGDVGTGTLTVADEGLEMDLKDENEVDQSATSTDVVVCTKFISASAGHFVINEGNFLD